MDACDMHDGIGNVNTAWGGVTAAIYFQALPKLQLGASYTFSSSSFKHTDDCNIYYHVIMLNGKYDYYRKGILKMYAHVGIGADISHMTFGDDSRNKGLLRIPGFSRMRRSIHLTLGLAVRRTWLRCPRSPAGGCKIQTLKLLISIPKNIRGTFEGVADIFMYYRG